jgi:hypothetical protein
MAKTAASGRRKFTLFARNAGRKKRLDFSI